MTHEQLMAKLLQAALDDAQKLRAALNEFMSDEVHNLVVNQHLLSDGERRVITGDLIRKLPELYEKARLALAEVKS